MLVHGVGQELQSSGASGSTGFIFGCEIPEMNALPLNDNARLPFAFVLMPPDASVLRSRADVVAAVLEAAEVVALAALLARQEALVALVQVGLVGHLVFLVAVSGHVVAIQIPNRHGQFCLQSQI